MIWFRKPQIPHAILFDCKIRSNSNVSIAAYGIMRSARVLRVDMHHSADDWVISSFTTCKVALQSLSWRPWQAYLNERPEGMTCHCNYFVTTTLYLTHFPLLTTNRADWKHNIQFRGKPAQRFCCFCGEIIIVVRWFVVQLSEWMWRDPSTALFVHTDRES